MSDLVSAQIVMERADTLATFSEETDRLTRRFATPALVAASDAVAGWMCEAGMSVHHDHAGNLIGRYEANRPDAKTLLLGSHLDSVRDAGKYDGPLGVLVAIACVQQLHDAKQRLPFAIEVLAFVDEEGLRYHTAYLGSSVLTGTFDPAWLDLVDADGIVMADALRAVGGDPDALQGDQRRFDDVLGYCEVHIEQGPVLQAHHVPVGAVSAIAGQSRFTVSFTGMAGHAGTVPMALRKDALCTAAEFVLAVEALAQHTSGLVATIGQIDAQPGASNVIPGKVTCSLDVRHQHDVTRQEAIQQLKNLVTEIAAKRQVALAWDVVQETDAVPCSPQLASVLERAIAAEGIPVHQLPSGAGHDGVKLAERTNVTMLFVRCKDGISHNPAEAITTDDVAVSIAVLARFLQLLAENQGAT